MRKSRLNDKIQSKLLDQFIEGSSARRAAIRCHVNRKTATAYFHKLREIITHEMKIENQALYGGQFCIDGDFIAHANRNGRRHHFVIFDRLGKVCIDTVSNAIDNNGCSEAKIETSPDAFVGETGINTSDTLALSEISLSFAVQSFASVRRIEIFWHDSSIHLNRHKGVPIRNAEFYLKACEWRCQFTDKPTMLDQIKQHVKNWNTY